MAAPALTLAAWLPSEAHATVARALSLPELVTGSRATLLGVPREASSHWETLGGSRRIVTYTRVEVVEPLGGDPGAELLLRTLGGRVGKIGQIVHGEAVLTLDQPTVLFVTDSAEGPPVVTAMGQGEYPVHEEGDGERRLRLSPRMPELHGGADARAAARRLAGRPLGEARQLIAQEWRRGR